VTNASRREGRRTVSKERTTSFRSRRRRSGTHRHGANETRTQDTSTRAKKFGRLHLANIRGCARGVTRACGASVWEADRRSPTDSAAAAGALDTANLARPPPNRFVTIALHETVPRSFLGRNSFPPFPHPAFRAEGPAALPAATGGFGPLK